VAAALQALGRLQLLDLHANSVSSLQQLAALSSLQELNAAGNRLQQLPCLASLTRLTTLNLRRNQLASLQPAAAAAVAPAPQQLTDPTYSDSSSSVSDSLLPPSLVRLSLAQNRLSQPALLLPLRQLPALAELSVEGNPWQQQGGSRAQLLGCCPGSLLLLDGVVVSPSERVAILTSAVKHSTAQRGCAAAAAGAISSGLASRSLAVQLADHKQQSNTHQQQQQWLGDVQQPEVGVELQDATQLVLQQEPCSSAPGSEDLQAAMMQVLGQQLCVQQRQRQQQQQQQQQHESAHPPGRLQAGQRCDQQGHSSAVGDDASTMRAEGELELGAADAASCAVPLASAVGDDVVNEGNQVHVQDISSVVPAAAEAAAATSNHTSSSNLGHLAPVLQQQQQPSAGSQPRSSIAAKLRPYSADDLAAHGSSSSSQQHQASRRHVLSSAGPAGSHTEVASSGSLLSGSRAARGPGSLAGYAAFAASCSAKAAAHLADERNSTAALEATADAGCESLGLAQEFTVLQLSGDVSEGVIGNEPALDCGIAEQQQQQQATGAADKQLAASAAAPSLHGLAASSAAATTGPQVMDEQGTAATQEAAAAATAPTQAAPAERYQGPLALAAVACGIMLPEKADTTAEGCPAHYCTTGVFLPAVGEDPDEYPAAAAAAAAAAGGVAISAAELEAHYLQAKQAVVSTDR
jgi:hypothetical protein